ncbi:MAG: serine/threonine-protein kinase [Polyangiaceae bacterium]
MAARLGPDSVLGGKYRLIKRLAGGGMGAVWLAKHELLDAEVAVKLMAPILAETQAARARFEREAKASAQLKSLHICKVQDYGVEDDTPYMVMERLDGQDFGDRLAQVGRLTPAELSPIVTQICKALTVAHAAGIVHRDLKPSNVFLVREGQDEVVKLLDFGIARELSTQLVDEKTASGTVIGSPHHMSPEQARGERVDQRSDLWSLGVVMFKALTGKRPFDGDQVTAVMLAIVGQPIPQVSELCPDLPKALDDFFDRALSRELDGRFSSAAELAEAFAAIAGGGTGAPWVQVRTRPANGQDEITRAAAPAATPLANAEGSEATASRELRAVTTQSSSAPGSRSLAWRLLPWVALIAIVGIAGFFLGRRGQNDSAAPSTQAASPAPSAVASVGATAPSSIEARATTEPAQPVVTPATSSAAGLASGSTRALRPWSSAARPTPTIRKSAATVDPFTGLAL